MMLSRSFILLLLLLLLLLLSHNLATSASTFDEQFDDSGFIPECSMMQSVVAILVNFSRIGAILEKQFHDAEMSVSTRIVNRSLSLDLDIDEQIEEQSFSRCCRVGSD